MGQKIQECNFYEEDRHFFTRNKKQDDKVKSTHPEKSDYGELPLLPFDSPKFIMKQ